MKNWHCLPMLILAFLSGCKPAPVRAPVTVSPSTGVGERAARELKIGLTYNLKGPVAEIGIPAAKGSILAIKEINTAGGVFGNPLMYVLVDTSGDAVASAEVAAELIEKEKVIAIVGNTDSDAALAIGPVAQKAGILYLTAGATSPRLPEQIGDYMFLAPFGDNVQAAAGAEFMFRNLGCKKAGLLWDQKSEFPTLLVEYWKARYAELGGIFVREETFSQGDTDFSAQIERLKQASPEAGCLFVASLPADAGVIVLQLRKAGLTMPVMGGDSFDGPDMLRVAGKEAEGVYFTTHALVSERQGTDKMRKFMTAYAGEYGKPPESAFAALGYDAVYLVVDAIRRARSSDPKAIRDALAATSAFEAVTGTISYQTGVRIPQKTVTIIAIKGGQFTLAAEVTPGGIPAP